jgi:hypothetical protein
LEPYGMAVTSPTRPSAGLGPGKKAAADVAPAA